MASLGGYGFAVVGWLSPLVEVSHIFLTSYFWAWHGLCRLHVTFVLCLELFDHFKQRSVVRPSCRIIGPGIQLVFILSSHLARRPRLRDGQTNYSWYEWKFWLITHFHLPSDYFKGLLTALWYIEKVTRGSRVGGNRWKAGCIGGSGVETGGNVYLDMESG